jgi:putative pyruvate formate lyase activating enzyme
VNRVEGELGICRTDASFPVASVVLHKGEEPAISGSGGIINIFFAHCNLHCRFCQNHQISDPGPAGGILSVSLESLLTGILTYIDEGIPMVGFVSPSHVLPQVRVIMQAIRVLRPDCRFVYNTNAYDKADALRELEGLVDVWLPDLKYMDASLGLKLSGVGDYPEIAGLAVREMFRQKGSSLLLDSDGRAFSGMIIRHLVLPGEVENSLSVLQFIASDLSPRVWISLMSQYYPAHEVRNDPQFGRTIKAEEYQQVIAGMEALGMERGWVQEPGSSGHYLPDFRLAKPFNDDLLETPPARPFL